MAKRRRYTDEERASLIVMLQSEGYPDKLGALKKVAEYAGIQPNVLRRWWQAKQNPPPNKLVAQKKEDMVAALERVVWKLLNSLSDADAIESAPLAQRATAYGIVQDKLNLLKDKPTERVAVEHSGQLTIDERRRHIAEVLNADRELRRVTGLSATDD